MWLTPPAVSWQTAVVRRAGLEWVCQLGGSHTPCRLVELTDKANAFTDVLCP